MATLKSVAVFARTVAVAVALALPFAAWAEAGAGSLTPIYTLPGHLDGGAPNGPLVRVGTRLFGTTLQGGTAECGTVFSVDPKTAREAVVYSFTCLADGGMPQAGLAVMGGKLFGTTSSAGPSNRGTVFKVDPETGAETTLAGFDTHHDKASAPLTGFRGLLYGTTNLGGDADMGSIFTVDPAAGTITTIYSFKGIDGAAPLSALIQAGGKLYGTTPFGGKHGRGAIYRIEPKTGAVTSLYSFLDDSDGQFPEAPLMEMGGILYGTTSSDSKNYAGVVFSFDPASRTEHVLHTFTRGLDGDQLQNGLTSANGLLYGLTSSDGQLGHGTLFSIDPVSAAETTLHAFTASEGDTPRGSLVLNGSLLYGTMAFRGYSDDGTVFSFDPATTATATLHVFTGYVFDGVSTMIQVGASLYGTTETGGASGLGSIFKVDRTTGAGKIVYSFTGKDDGAQPYAALIEVGGILYGTTTRGGSGQSGTVFGFDPGTHKLRTLHDFAGGADGVGPTAAMVVLNGLLYGTTSNGGPANAGTVYKIDPVSGAETILYSFKARNDGTSPQAGLTVANGLLYGAARFGGAHQCGALFNIDPSTGDETVLFSFEFNVDGCQPTTTLLYANGVFYGATYGHRPGLGTAFMFDPSNNTETVLHEFKPKAGPTTPFIAVQNRLYAATREGGNEHLGSLISLDPATGNVTTLHSFTGGSDGEYPSGGLLHLDGTIYGASDLVGSAGLVFGFTK